MTTNDPDDLMARAPDDRGPNDTLSPSEATDSDEVRNVDGDEVVDPPDEWYPADRRGMSSDEAAEGESLDDKLAAEEPDTLPLDDSRTPEEDEFARRHHGQISGSPEDGDSFFNVIR